MNESVNTNAEICTADITVIATNATSDMLDYIDEFIYVEGWPDKSAGLSFDHDEMVLYFMKDGALKALTVESPVAADSAMEYSPVDALKALLYEAGIQILDDKLHSDVVNDKALCTNFHGLRNSSCDTSTGWVDLTAEVDMQYCYLSWE